MPFNSTSYGRDGRGAGNRGRHSGAAAGREQADPSAPRASGRLGEMPQLVLGRYRLIEERGKGGFGTVSVCWDPRLMRRVAIKSIPLHQDASPDPADPAERARADALLRAALAETRTASMLAHPNIVAMLDFEADASNAYIIMEYVEGASLAELLDATDDGLLTADEAAAVADAVCDALAFAHDNGVLHLDIKPDNILIDASGRVRLADFGMAALSNATGYGGAVGGTIGYMPPEQLQSGQVDVRTDVFAIASVMYEALTGTMPFAATTLKQSLELICGQLADPCALNDDVSHLSADALLVALDPDPDVRPSSVRAFCDELMAGLGNPRIGRQSLAALVADVTSDEEDEEEAPDTDDTPLPRGAFWFEQGPVSQSFPRLAGWLLRGTAGFASAWVAALASLVWAGSDGVGAAVVAAVVVGVVGTVVPQLAGALAVVALTVACVAARLWVMAFVVPVLGAVWWGFCVHAQPLGTGMPLLGAVGAQVTSPVTPVLCGMFLTPARAAVSALMGFATCVTLCALGGSTALDGVSLASLGLAKESATLAVASGTNPALETLASLAKDPSTWVFGAAWVSAAAALSGLCSRGGKGFRFLGILASACILGAFQLVIARMENGGLWASPAPEAMAGVLASSILACIIVCLFGTPRSVLSAEAGDDSVFDDDIAREDLSL